MKQPSQWERIKQEGRAAVLRDSPETVGHFDTVIASALASGLLINPYGELESLWPEGRKFAKSEWLVNVLEKPDLATDPELEIARRFVTELIELSIKKANFGSPV